MLFRSGLLFSINDTRQGRCVHSELAVSLRFRGYGVGKLITFLKILFGLTEAKPEPRKHSRLRDNSRLLHFDFATSFFELLLGGVGVGLVRAFQHGLRSAFDESFRFREAEAGFHFANRLDDGNLLVSRS